MSVSVGGCCRIEEIINGLDQELQSFSDLLFEAQKLKEKIPIGNRPPDMPKALGIIVELDVRVTPTEESLIEKTGRVAQILRGTGLHSNLERSASLAGRVVGIRHLAEKLRDCRAALKQILAPVASWERHLLGRAYSQPTLDSLYLNEYIHTT